LVTPCPEYRHDDGRDRNHPEDLEHVRIDKWLWAARFYKTRGAATEAVTGGRVHVNGARVKPSKEVAAGDTVEISTPGLKRTVQVTAVAERRGSAKVA
jgi:ribosome-associated heat shock protein Hsp15